MAPITTSETFFSVSASSADDGFYSRIEPHAHEIRRAALVLLSGEAAKLENVGIEYHLISSALERLRATHEMTFARRVRGRHDPDRLAARDCGWTNQPLPRGENFELRGIV